ncbi:MAG: hypothetical protein R3F37_07520 [Candidatus Competibacteraceae bacterium]
MTRHTVTPLRARRELSLISTAPLPEQWGVFVNGDGAGVLLSYAGNPQSWLFFSRQRARCHTRFWLIGLCIPWC